MKSALVFLGVIISTFAIGQIRLSKLVLRPKQVYEIKGSDILVVDSLIMQDSSRIILNKLKPENFIHAKVAVFYRGALIDGHGATGIPGRKGKPGNSPMSPCTNGAPGTMGTEGTNGGHGINVSLYFSEIMMRGNVTIDVSGGAAGDGGEGGVGGGGGPGTRLCKGGNGGQGGAGANGGNGGDAGSVNFVCPKIPELRLMLGEKIIVRNYGGDRGIGGNGGAGGYSGLSALQDSKMDGKPGRKGVKGSDGLAGKPGSVNFPEK
ncbi:MAG TPA: hypothetical protein VG737_13425 [Cyclobacteriaceae bacterium]|nr:hypothetical protein [Cyclobacteriaceae bacterium]